MPTELAKTYRPADVEPQIAQRWNAAQAFHAEPASADVEPATGATATGAGDGPARGAKSYCIVIPPPNVTAALHMGHALNNTLQDILIRWHRMLGDNTVWIPGTDHAGIATQTVVDKRLQAEGQPALKDYKRLEAEGKNGREQFIAKVQAWKDEYEATILGQLKAMGCSCDWERTRFTMDEVCAKAVREAFFRLFRDGLIYRGKRLVNWDPATQTALADDEVEMEEVDGQFYYLRYPLVPLSGAAEGPPSSSEYVTVATTRPETMLGDTAVAINPKDPRAAALRRRKVRLPIVNRIVPIIEDEYVTLPDPNSEDAKAKFGTGCLKVTPAHDPNDYELGQKHQAELGDHWLINVLAPDGTISDQHGWPADDVANADKEALPLGLDRYEAREAVVAWFQKNGLLEAVKPYRHAIGHSYRSHVAIEPYLSDQWYVKVTNDRLRGAALRAMVDDQYELTAADVSARLRDTGNQKSEIRNQKSAWEGRLRFWPARYAKTFQAWHENIRDWCISRQLWWGHRIPVWTVVVKESSTLQEAADTCLAVFRIKRMEDSVTVRIDEAGHRLLMCTRNGDADLVMAGIRCASTNTWESPAFASLTPPGERAAFAVKDLIDSVQRDPDVLDTWFSSALWPFSTLGWPEETAALATWNPGNLLCTAREIITLWVSRMVMTNLYFRDCLPFTDVFIHAMIQDGEGRKMSKSLGNGVDPLDIIHSHGSDAMRYTLAAMTTNTQDVRMPVERDSATGRNTSPKFDLGRNFANKLWNAVRFALANLEPSPFRPRGRGQGEGLDSPSSSPAGTEEKSRPSPQPSPSEGRGGLSTPDRWILSRLARTVHDTNAALEQYEFSAYAQGLYDFIWRDLCDWYIEAVKPTVRENPTQRAVLAACLDATLRLLHPVMPFITEKLWEALNEVAPQRHAAALPGVTLPASELLIRAAWPRVDATLIDPEAEANFELVRQIVAAVREVRTAYKVPTRQVVLTSARTSPAFAQRLLAQRPLIEALTNIQGGEIGPKVAKPADAASAVVGEVELYLHGLIVADAEKSRLSKRVEELTRSIDTLQKRLGNKAYVDKAPPHLVQQTREQLAALEREAAAVRQQLAAL